MEAEFIARYLGPDGEAQSLEAHLEEVANLANIFASKIGLPSFGRLAGLLHDFGKYSKDFQVYIRAAEGQLEPKAEPGNVKELKGRIDHSTAGAQLVWETLKDQGHLHRLIGQIVALCIASHHSGLIDCLSPDGEDKFSSRMGKARDKTHLDEAIIKSQEQVLANINSLLHAPQIGEELRIQLEGLFQGEESRTVREFYLSLLVRFLFSALIDGDRLSAARRRKSPGSNGEFGPQWSVLIKRLEEHISGIDQRNWVDQIRSEISLACRDFASREKGLYQLTVPTGGAKTLSSLRFALHHAAIHQMHRLIYVIPYTSIIDQNAAVARAILQGAPGTDPGPIVLEHHSNLTPEKETWQGRLIAENWDAPVIFTTTVQFLEALFAGGTRGVRRMHNLANAIIIFDEVQTLPIKTVHLFNNAINFLVKQGGATVVFCTATQPLLHAVDPMRGAAKLAKAPEMAPRPGELFRMLRRVEVLDMRKTGGWTEEETAHCICDEAKRAGSTLAVVNTKAAARCLYGLCRSKLKTVYHLSASMCPLHRLDILEEIKRLLAAENHEPVVCVSTQLVEAGVDIDFGAVLRYLAGLDSIAQAAGRCNRNGRNPSGRVLVCNPSDETLDRLPEIQVGKEVTERLLDEFRRAPDAFDHDLLSPKAMQQYYEYYFFNRSKDMAYPVPSKDIGHDDELLNLLSTNSLSLASYVRKHKSAPPLPLRYSFKNAGRVFKVINAPTEGIVVPYGEKARMVIAGLCAVSNLEETRQLLREAQRYSVNLYPHDLEKLSHLGCIYETQQGSGIFYLDERYYSMEMGVVFEQEESMDFLNG